MSHWTGPQMEGSMSLRLSSVAGEVSSAPCLHHCLQRCLVTGSQASRQEVCVEESQLIGEYQTKVWNSQGQIRAVFLKYLWSLSSFTWWSCMHTCENAHTHTQTKLSLNILIFSIYFYFFLENTTLPAHICGDSESINVRWSIELHTFHLFPENAVGFQKVFRW